MSKKGENIYKRKDKRWEGRFIKGYSATGKPLFCYCYGRTYKETKQKLFEAKSKPKCGKKSQMVFADYCTEWLCITESKVRVTTALKYEAILRNHILPCLGSNKVQDISSKKLADFAHYLSLEKKLAPKTVKDIIAVLKAVIAYAIKQSALSIEMPDVPKIKENGSEVLCLSSDEEMKLIVFLSNQSDPCKFGVLLALLTGMRIGEICALQWKDISVADGTVFICKTMQRIRNSESKTNRTSVVIAEPKTDKSKRTVPLSERALQLCRTHYNEDGEAFILTGCSGKYVEPRLLQYRIKQYMRQCGLDEIHFHMLRHSFATRCLEAGVDIKTLSELLGHANATITLNRYVHSSLELKRRNIAKLSALGF